MINESLLEIASKYPFPIEELRPLFNSCQKLYFPNHKAVNKFKEILDTALDMGISVQDSYKLQFQIDFNSNQLK